MKEKERSNRARVAKSVGERIVKRPSAKKRQEEEKEGPNCFHAKEDLSARVEA